MSDLPQVILKSYLRILEKELLYALGCTEPIAIAYAAAKARAVLNMPPETIEVLCSGNIFKNVKGVTVPRSGGRKGIETAAILGALAGNAERALSVLETVTPNDYPALDKMLAEKACTCILADGVYGLYIKVLLRSGPESAAVEVKNKHDHITRIEKNGLPIFELVEEEQASPLAEDYKLLNVRDILQFAEEVPLHLISGLMEMQIEANHAISLEGLANGYGAEVGRTLQKESEGLRCLLKAAAAAGSDARMSGCSLPVVINSGSGNQGITISLPIFEYARHINAPKEKLYRALALGNLLSVHQKRFVGPLSAYCGAASAAAASMAAVTWLSGGSYDQICGTITNTAATIGGMVCDGAKPSCAAKISAAMDAAYTAHLLSMEGQVFHDGEGLVGRDIEDTIRKVGRMARDGMRSTDTEILHIMMGS